MSSSENIAIKVEDLSKCFHIYNQPVDRLKQSVMPRLQRFLGLPQKQYCEDFWALKDISFEIYQGETVGIIGQNGSGKSTLLQLICGTLNPTSGSIITNGRIAALLELGSGFNPEFTGRDNVYMNSSLLGLSREEIDLRFDEIAAFADIGQFIEQPVKTYSSGMFVRLAFAVNIISNPTIMVVDEALSVGDMAFQAKCMSALKRIQNNGATILFVSHDVSSVKSLCSKGIYLERGCIKAIGKAPDIAEQYIKTMHEEMNATHESLLSNESKVFTKNTVMNSSASNLMKKSDDLLKYSDDFNSRVSTFRYGSGEAKIYYVELLDMANNPIHSLDFNQEIIINIYFESYADLDISVYYGIMDDKKISITGTGFRHLGLPLINAKCGDRHMVSFKTRLPLIDGNYSLLAQLSIPIIPNQTAKFIDVVDNAVVFSINKWEVAKLWSKVHLSSTCKIQKEIN